MASVQLFNRYVTARDYHRTQISDIALYNSGICLELIRYLVYLIVEELTTNLTDDYATTDLQAHLEHH